MGKKKYEKNADARIQNSKQTLEFVECSQAAQNLALSLRCVCVRVCVSLTILHILRKRRIGCIQNCKFVT